MEEVDDVRSNEDFLPFRIHVLGAKGSGKTCLMKRFTNGTFAENEKTTLTKGCWYDKIETIENRKVKYSIYEFNETRWNPELRDSDYGCDPYLFGSDRTPSIIITYKITDSESFNIMKKIANKARSLSETPIFLVGTHSDSHYGLEVSTDEVQEFAKTLTNCRFLGEVSASTGKGVEEVFHKIVKPYVKEYNQNQEIRAQEVARINERDLLIPKKNNAIESLEKYTSAGNTFSAYARWFFSFGRFGLGIEKLKLARELKCAIEESETNDIKSIDVNSFKARNNGLVRDEYIKSCFFAENYGKKSNGTPISYPEGQLGAILENITKFSPLSNKK